MSKSAVMLHEEKIQEHADLPVQTPPKSIKNPNKIVIGKHKTSLVLKQPNESQFPITYLNRQ